MDLASLLQLLRRQWVIVGLIMLVSGTSAYLTWTGASPSYRANATLSVLPPLVNVEGVPRNPYLEIASASNADLAQRLSIQLNGTTWRRQLTDEGHSPDYLVDHGDGTSPVLRANVETSERALAVSTLDAVIVGLGEELDSQQERFDINQPAKFTIDVLDQSNGAVRIYGNRTRLTGAVVVLGLIASVVGAQLLDNFQKRGKKEARPAPATRAERATNGRSAVREANGSPAGKTDEQGIWIPSPNVRGVRGGPRPQNPAQAQPTAVSTQAPRQQPHN